MKIFGEQWKDGVVSEQYVKGVMLDGVICYRHEHTKDPIFYDCALCGFHFLHWLCSDEVWKTLPKPLWDQVICEDCFAAFRGYNRLLKKDKSAAKKRPKGAK